MKRMDYVAIIAISLLMIIIVTSSLGLFSSNMKQEGVQKHIQGMTNLILSKINQTEILLHEDDERRKQNTINSVERDNQTQLLLKEIKGYVLTLFENYTQTVDRQNNTTNKILYKLNLSLANQEIMLNKIIQAMLQNENITKGVLNMSNIIYQISNEHKQVAKDHDKIQNDMKNTTGKVDNQTLLTYQVLNKYGSENQEIGKNSLQLNKDTNKVVHDLNTTMGYFLEYLNKTESVD